MKRIPIGKRLRFEIFARDGFTCRYCGRQADQTILHVDHVIPVSQGGTNDPENLVTACADCNLGKSDSAIQQAAPSESDRLRLAQEMNEQVAAAKKAAESAQARADRRQTLVNFWCDETGREEVDRATISTVFSYVQEFGEEVVFGWIEKAAVKCRNDRAMGQYISGIRRIVKAEQEESES
jgi:hypothetical protein